MIYNFRPAAEAEGTAGEELPNDKAADVRPRTFGAALFKNIDDRYRSGQKAAPSSHRLSGQAAHCRLRTASD